MSTPTLKVMLAKYAMEDVPSVDFSLESPLKRPAKIPVEILFPGCIAFIAFYKRLTGVQEPNLDDLSQNLAIGFIQLLKAEVDAREFQSMCWDLRDWLKWLYEHSYTWTDLGADLEPYLVTSTSSAA